MAESIYTDSYVAGRGTDSPGESGSKHPPLATVLRGLIDDIAAARAPAIAAAAIAAVAAAAYRGKGAVLSGGEMSGPTTGSTQASGVGNTDWNIDLAAGLYEVNSTVDAVAASADFDIHSASFLTGLANGSSCIAAIVVKDTAGTLSYDKVKGTPATTGTQVAPTTAEIDTGIGHQNWTKLGEVTINRDGDTSVTESYSMATRESPIRQADQTRYNEVRTLLGTLRTLANEVRTDLNAIAVATPSITKG